jgi:hypothetical protein
MDGANEISVARELDIGELGLFGRVHYRGGAAAATVQQEAMAVATGVADVVVAYRAFNERSGRRFGQVSEAAARQVNSSGVDKSFHHPMGITPPAATVAMLARRYMHEFGATSEDFGRIAVLDRARAGRREAERARDLPYPPAVVAAAAQGGGLDQYVMTSYYRDELPALPEMGAVGRRLWAQSGLRPADVDVALHYDHFTPHVLMQLEELGFRGRGEGFHHGGPSRTRRRAAVEPPKWPARRGLHPWYERDRRSCAADPGHRGQPGSGSRPCAGHRRDRRADQWARPQGADLSASLPSTTVTRSAWACSAHALGGFGRQQQKFPPLAAATNVTCLELLAAATVRAVGVSASTVLHGFSFHRRTDPLITVGERRPAGTPPSACRSGSNG